jgi:hypothetical protein
MENMKKTILTISLIFGLFLCSNLSFCDSVLKARLPEENQSQNQEPQHNEMKAKEYEFIRELEIISEDCFGWANLKIDNYPELYNKSINPRRLYSDLFYEVNLNQIDEKNIEYYFKDFKGSDEYKLRDLNKLTEKSKGLYFERINEVSFDIVLTEQDEIILEKNESNIDDEVLEINKLVIDYDSSIISNIEIFDFTNNKKLEIEKIYNFDKRGDWESKRTEIYFKGKTKRIRIKLNYDNFLHLKRIKIYNRKIADDKIKFFVDGNCDKKHYLFYGGYGDVEVEKSPDIDVMGLSSVGSVSLKNEIKNELYNFDIDNDTIENDVDNCLKISNVDQTDLNNNNIGDACEDFDGDGIMNYKDNCMKKKNRNQKDIDKDGIGDVCDESDDRFSEKYKWGIYIIAIIMIGIFGFVAFRVLKEK